MALLNLDLDPRLLQEVGDLGRKLGYEKDGAYNLSPIMPRIVSTN